RLTFTEVCNMSSPLTTYERIEWLLQFTAKRIFVVLCFCLAASLVHSRPVHYLQRAADYAGQERVNPTPTPSPAPLPTTAPTPTGTQPLQDEDALRVPSMAPNYQSDNATYPQLAMIGVQFDRQQSMSLRE